MKKTKKHNKKSSKKINKKSPVYYINIIIIVLIVMILAFLTNAIFLSDNNQKIIKNKPNEKIIKKEHKKKTISFEEQTKELHVQYVPTIPKKEILTNNTNTFDLHKQTNKNEKKLEKNNKKITIKEESIFKSFKEEVAVKKEIVSKKNINKITTNKKPKLAILIDDITTSRQVKKANNLPFKVTLSFLPPTPTHKYSAKIAQNLKVHMIHLPLEAGNRNAEEINTLHIEDSLDKIDKRIKYLKSIYPKVKYINNHTGSKFTSNEKAMDKLVKVLKKYDYYFIDSRTTAKTKIKKYAKKYNLKYLSRNVFLDNEEDVKYIQKQLKQAIKIAKKHGFAIAICHPYNVTYEALNKSKNILKDIDLVYINELKIK